MHKYWLFQIMYDWYPETWPLFVKKGIAAHNYPPGWDNEGPNIRRFEEMSRGDWIIAAFTCHRFAGYARLRSNFYRGGPSLKYEGDDNVVLDFEERFDCDWRVLPVAGDPPHINCHDLKAEGYNIDLERGRGAKQIDNESFDALKARLNLAGARKPSSRKTRSKAR